MAFTRNQQEPHFLPRGPLVDSKYREVVSPSSLPMKRTPSLPRGWANFQKEEERDLVRRCQERVKSSRSDQGKTFSLPFERGESSVVVVPQKRLKKVGNSGGSVVSANGTTPSSVQKKKKTTPAPSRPATQSVDASSSSFESSDDWSDRLFDDDDDSDWGESQVRRSRRRIPSSDDEAEVAFCDEEEEEQEDIEEEGEDEQEATKQQPKPKAMKEKGTLSKKEKAIFPEYLPFPKYMKKYAPWIISAAPDRPYYRPQLGDWVIYIPKGHQAYLNAHRADIDYKLPKSIPLSSVTLGRVESLSFKPQPSPDFPFCVLTLNANCQIGRERVVPIEGVETERSVASTRLRERGERGSHIELVYHVSDDVCDYLVLASKYKKHISVNWTVGHRAVVYYMDGDYHCSIVQVGIFCFDSSFCNQTYF